MRRSGIVPRASATNDVVALENLTDAIERQRFHRASISRRRGRPEQGVVYGFLSCLYGGLEERARFLVRQLLRAQALCVERASHRRVGRESDDVVARAVGRG